MKHSRVFGIDLVRAVAIGLVLLGHSSILIPPESLGHMSRKLLLYLGGYFGVELFFVLSGFLIGGLLLKLFCDSDAPVTWQRILNFWVRRWFRTLPNYYLFLLLNLTLFSWWFGSGVFDLRHVFFLQNLAWPGSALMPESWSLAVEEWFYLTIPLALGVAVRYVASRKRAVLLALCVYIALFTALRLAGVALADPAWDAGVRKVVMLRLDAIAWGFLIAWLVRFHGAKVSRHARSMMLVGIGLVAVAVYLVTDGVLHSFETGLHETLLFTLTNLGLALLLPWLSQCHCHCRRLRGAVTRLSLVSYSAYLLHFSFVIPLLGQPLIADTLPWPVIYLLYVLVTLVLSMLLFLYFESPMTRLRERFAASPAGGFHNRAEQNHSGKVVGTNLK